MSEKIDWDALLRTIEVTVCKTVTEKLPEGLYACPRCEGTGRIQVGHADPGPNPTIRCGMCNGTQKIKKCKVCRENPVALNDKYGMCNECSTKGMEHIIELEKRPEVICDFPQWITQCPHPGLQEFNSDRELVCDLELCEYSQRKLSVYPSECIVRKTNGDAYCLECVDREICPMDKAK